MASNEAICTKRELHAGGVTLSNDAGNRIIPAYSIP